MHTAEPNAPPWPRLVGALAVHVLMVPWWFLLAGLATDGLRGPHPITERTVLGILASGWIWLGVKLIDWWRQRRRPLWPYPLKWAFGISFSILFLIALLFHRFRRSVIPPPVPTE